MNDIGDEGSENIMNLEETLQIGYIHQVVHTLKGVYYVDLVVIGVVLEIAISDLENIKRFRS